MGFLNRPTQHESKNYYLSLKGRMLKPRTVGSAHRADKGFLEAHGRRLASFCIE